MFSQRKLIWAAGVVLLVLATAAGVLLLTTSDEARPDVASAQGEPPTEWDLFSLPDGSLRFEYPVNWPIDHQGVALAMSNNSALLEVDAPRVATGDVLLYFYGFGEASAIGLEDAATPADALDLIVDSQGARSDFGDIESLTIGAYDAAQVRFTNSGLEGAYMVLATETRNLTLASIAAGGEYDAQREHVRRIAESVQFDADLADPDSLRVFADNRIGNPDAEIVITEYGAYGCHACREVHQQGVTDQIVALVEASEGRVQFVFVNFPVIAPQHDPISAEVGQCVRDSSEDDFWRYHNGLYDISDNQYYAMRSADAFISFAGELGIDTPALVECMDARTHRGTVAYNLQRSSRAGVRSTPTFVVNGQRVSPFQVATLVDDLLN